MPEIGRDKYWRGPPASIEAWAALSTNGEIMPNTVRRRKVDVNIACGKDCVPIKVLVSYVECG